MKRIAILFLIIPTLFLVSCKGESMFFIDTDRKIAQKQIEIVLDAIQNEDTKKLQSLFSKNALEQVQTFDDTVVSLFDYVDGFVESYDDKSGPYVEYSIEDGFEFELMQVSVDVETDTCDYRFAMQFITKGNENDIGLTSLYVIKASEDADLERSYWGDVKFTPGINIAVPNAEPI